MDALHNLSYINSNITSIFLVEQLAIICALLVISATNPIYSVFGLIGLFINTSIILFSLGLDFIAIILLIIYIGAIAVLFLFVIMMLHLNLALLHDNLVRYLPIGTILGFILLLDTIWIMDDLLNDSLLYEPSDTIGNESINAINIYAEVLYSEFAVYFLMCGLILFVAMIGAIIITQQHTSDINKRVQDANNQLFIKY